MGAGRTQPTAGLQWASNRKVQCNCPHAWTGLDDNVTRPAARRFAEKACLFALCFDAGSATSEETLVPEGVVADRDVSSCSASYSVVRSLGKLLVALGAKTFTRQNAAAYPEQRSHREFSSGETKTRCPRGWGVEPGASVCSGGSFESGLVLR